MLSSLGSALLKKQATNSTLSKQVEAGMVVEKAQQTLDAIFGSDISANAKVLFIKNRTLTVTCSHGSVSQDIRLRMQEIVEKINRAYGSSVIDRIRYLS